MQRSCNLLPSPAHEFIADDPGYYVVTLKQYDLLYKQELGLPFRQFLYGEFFVVLLKKDARVRSDSKIIDVTWIQSAGINEGEDN